MLLGEDMEVALLGITTFIVVLTAMKKKKAKARRWWERPHLGVRNRRFYGQQNLLQEMRLTDVESFEKTIRLRPDSFDKLLSIVGPSLAKLSNREPISPFTRLAVTLRYLATGESKRSLALNYRLGVSTTHCIIKETLEAIYKSLKPIVLPDLNKKSWLKVAEGFLNRWNIQNCCGALDGKHIRTQKPAHSGSEYYNYKKFFSTVMMAICDSEYKFIAADTGSQGRNNDVIVLQESGIGRQLINGDFDLPGEKEIKYGPVLPHYFLGDEIFGLKPYMMIPYPGRGTDRLDYTKKIFNYRQSRGRRVIENAYGIFANVWGIFRTEIRTTPANVDRIVMAAVCLHNFRIMEKESIDEFLTDTASGRTNKLHRLDSALPIVAQDPIVSALPTVAQDPVLAAVAETKLAERVRDELAEYFVTGGRVYWQDSLIN